jgi:biotin synthase
MKDMRDSIQVSSASASFLQLEEKSLAIMPTTLYFMIGDNCEGNCMYCTGGNQGLSRVKWPPFSVDEITKKLMKKKVGRICFQCLYYPNLLQDLLYMLPKFKPFGIPISLSLNPIQERDMRKVKRAGVERIGIGLDCCTEKLFNNLKKNIPSWNEYLRALDVARKVFGHATAHLIIGLGESDEETIELMENLSQKGIKIALFAFTPMKRNIPQLPIERYRAIQLARYWLERGNGDFKFKNGTLHKMIVPHVENAFLTSGCPACNRPFYNERVRGPLYNYPRQLNSNELDVAINEVRKYVKVCTPAH